MPKQPRTFNDFSGGWNPVQDGLYMDMKYASQFVNMTLSKDGDPQARYGSSQLIDFNAVLGPNANVIYAFGAFSRFVVVLEDGRVVASDGAAENNVIFTGWATDALPWISHDWYGTKVYMFSTTHKPLEVSGEIGNGNVTAKLLEGPGGGNANVPLATLVTTVDQFLVVGGFSGFPPQVYDPYAIEISSVGDPTRWTNDTPTTAVRLDVSQYATMRGPIQALSEFRGSLFVHTPFETIAFRLGIFDSNGNHTPELIDVFTDFGALAHRTIKTVGEANIGLDYQGVASYKITRAASGVTTPTHVSDLIKPEIVKTLETLTLPTVNLTLAQSMAAWHANDDTYILLIRRDSGNVVYAMKRLPHLKMVAWSEYKNFDYDFIFEYDGSFYATRLGRLYRMGEDKLPYYLDFIGDTSKEPGGLGVSISFDWELPWHDFGNRIQQKKLTYMRVDADGPTLFTVQTYADRDASDTILTNQFASKEAPSPPPSVEIIDEEYLTEWPMTFNTMKMRIQGETSGLAKFESMSFLYSYLGVGR